ncbi:hypothetical protein F5Y16DRAFT_387935 [Xylariaceae sp. FL0255]|nr:hypothetical protein F5Y16DRAFT_387935 [Xylariaceae sp. FL0255]
MDEATANPKMATDNDDKFSSNDAAVDDTEDLSDDFVEMQKTISNERRREKNAHGHGISDLLPFQFAPNIRPLTISDLESCVALENAAFANPNHRCSKEKFEYRLTSCSELSMGVFCTVVPAKAHAESFDMDTLGTARPVETGRDDGAVSMLMAHIIATRSHDDVVTDDAMGLPLPQHSGGSSDEKGVEQRQRQRLGNQESGRTLCIHSLAVHPKVQGVGIGKLILKAYLQQVKNSDLADRVALICQEYLINYYKRFGFTHAGPSKASFGGGGWHDMTFQLGRSLSST